MSHPLRLSSREVLACGAIALLAGIVVFTGLPQSTKFMNVLHKTGHPVVFGLVALLLLRLLGGRVAAMRWPAWSAYVAAFVVAVLIGALTEVGQLLTHRDAQLADVVRDALGAVACLAAHAATTGRANDPGSGGWRWTWFALSLAAAALALAPLAKSAAAYVVRNGKFPVLLESPSTLDWYFMHSDLASFAMVPPNQTWSAGTPETKLAPAIKVAIDRGSYPGLSIDEPYPRWSGYQTLAVDIGNPGAEPASMVLRVHDRQHNNDYDDRFNRDFVLAAKSRTTLLIPLTEIAGGPKRRKLNLDAVANLNIFAMRPVPGGAFYIHKIWLQ